MTAIPAFFIPAATSELLEEVYGQFAEICHSAVPGPAHRVYSIIYNHDGDEWTATVGETLRGIRRKTVRSRGQKFERTETLSDRATVLAIFAGVPYIVLTTQNVVGNVGSSWESPFMAGQPSFVTYFVS